MRAIAMAIALGAALAALSSTERLDGARLPYQSSSGNAFRIFANTDWDGAKQIRRVKGYKGDEPDAYVWTTECARSRQVVEVTRQVDLLGHPFSGLLTYNAWGFSVNYVSMFELSVNGQVLLHYQGGDTQKVETMSLRERRAFHEGANSLKIRAVKKPTPWSCNDGNPQHQVGVRLQIVGQYRADLTTSQRSGDPLGAYALASPGQSVLFAIDATGAVRNRGPNLAVGGTATVDANPHLPGMAMLVQEGAGFEECRGDLEDLHNLCRFGRIDAGGAGALKILLRYYVPESTAAGTHVDFSITIDVAELPGEPGTNYAYYRLDPNPNNNRSIGFLRVCVPPIATKAACKAQ